MSTSIGASPPASRRRDARSRRSRSTNLPGRPGQARPDPAEKPSEGLPTRLRLALAPDHQSADGRRVRPSGRARTSCHLRGDRQLDAVPLAERQRDAPSCGRPRRPSSCRPGCRPAVRPRASSMPTCRLRLSSPVQVSTRSPSPLSPLSVSRLAAHRAGQPRDLGETARDQRRQGVVPEAERLDDAGGDRDDVLERAAHLDAHDVVARIQPETPAREIRPARSAAAAASRRRRDAARSADPAATSAAKLGPDSTTTGCRPPVSSAITSDIRSRLSGLEALGRAHDRGAAAADAARPPASLRGSRATEWRRPRVRRPRARARERRP